MKVCSRCGLEKARNEFYTRSDGRRLQHSWCKKCHLAYTSARYFRNRTAEIARVRRNRDHTAALTRRRIWKYLESHPCVDCGESDRLVLEFDHRRDKRRDIATMAGRGLSWSTMLIEIEKCEVRCANCHRRRTARQMGYHLRARLLESLDERPGEDSDLRPSAS